MSTDRFDAGYYRRFYGRNPVHTSQAVGDLAGADAIMRSALFVGVYPGLSQAMLDHVIDVLRDFARQQANRQ